MTGGTFEKPLGGVYGAVLCADRVVRAQACLANRPLKVKTDSAPFFDQAAKRTLDARGTSNRPAIGLAAVLGAQ